MNANAEDVNDGRPMAAGSAIANCDINNNLSDSVWKARKGLRERGREMYIIEREREREPRQQKLLL